MTENVRRLYRSRTQRMLGGVCGGLGKYLGIDPTIIRLVFLVLLFTQGFGFLIYIILWLLLPVEGGAETSTGSMGDRLGEGMKGVGEVGINGPLPAIAGAVSGACGIEITRAPLTAERIMEALERKRTISAGDRS